MWRFTTNFLRINVISLTILGEMALDLCRLPKPAKSVENVALPKANICNGQLTSDKPESALLMPSETQEPSFFNLFEVKRVYGFFPFSKMGPNGLEMAVRHKFWTEILDF